MERRIECPPEPPDLDRQLAAGYPMMLVSPRHEA